MGSREEVETCLAEAAVVLDSVYHLVAAQLYYRKHDAKGMRVLCSPSAARMELMSGCAAMVACVRRCSVGEWARRGQRCGIRREICKESLRSSQP